MRRAVLFRTDLASLASSAGGDRQVAAAADPRGWLTARAQTFLSDGEAYCRSTQRRHLPAAAP